MNPQDRFCVHHVDHGPVYASDRISGVVRYLWGRDVSKHVVLVYEVPVQPVADLEDFRRTLYAMVLEMTYPQGRLRR